MPETPEERKYLDPVPAIPVSQGETTFYVFSISAKRLLEIAYTSERTQYNRTGIQRGLRPDRLREIGKFLTSNGSSPALLPNAIIVSLSSDSKFRDGHLYICRRLAGEAFVIDGQHRLWAFGTEYSGAKDLNVVVSAFLDLDNAGKASIFRSINGNQRKINPSLVYDLIPMLRQTEPVLFEDKRCQELVAFLNETADSPWKDRIAMVGSGDRIISQSSFITSLKKLFKRGHLFASTDPDFFEERMQQELLLEYFRGISESYSAQWDNKEFLLCKYVGVSALLNLLERIITDLRGKGVAISDDKSLKARHESFQPYVSKLRSFSFSAAEARASGFSYVGEGGISALTERLNSVVFGR